VLRQRRIELLMYVPPGDGSHVRVRIDDAPEIVGIGEADAVQPAAAHGDGMVMQTHHGVLARFAERTIQALEFLLCQSTARVSRIVAVEHDELPARSAVGSAYLEWRLAERALHRFRLVVVARNAKHGLRTVAEDAAEAQIAGRIVLHQIAGHQDRGVIRDLHERLIEHVAQGRVGLHAAQFRAGVAVQMRVGYL
jgi:hypothetical protein